MLEERISDYFDIQQDSPYMLIVAPVREELRSEMSPETSNLDIYDRVKLEQLYAARDYPR